MKKSFARRPLGHVLFSLFAAAACCQALGCGDDSKRIHLSGNVTFDGKPVPAGKIYFIPDATKNHVGPSGYADIKDGHYDTSQKGAMGPSGGPLTIRIEGFTAGDSPEPLFVPYEETADIPKSTTKDISISIERKGNIPKSTAPPP